MQPLIADAIPFQLKAFGRRALPATWVISLALAIAFAAMRFAGTQGGVPLRPLLPLGFLLMAAVPWVLLDAEGRRLIGWAAPSSWVWVPAGVAAGAGAAALCAWLGLQLFGHSPDNWFVSVADRYRALVNTTGMGTLRLHLVFTTSALLFSPLGEEVFFRGFFQEALNTRVSLRTATIMECSAFALVHLCHHGLYWRASGLALRPLSGAISMLLMFGTANLFAWLRRRSGSLLPAIVSHMAFNACMNVLIFALLWN